MANIIMTILMSTGYGLFTYTYMFPIYTVWETVLGEPLLCVLLPKFFLSCTGSVSNVERKILPLTWNTPNVEQHLTWNDSNKSIDTFPPGYIRSKISSKVIIDHIHE